MWPTIAPLFETEADGGLIEIVADGEAGARQKMHAPAAGAEIELRARQHAHLTARIDAVASAVREPQWRGGRCTGAGRQHARQSGRGGLGIDLCLSHRKIKLERIVGITRTDFAVLHVRQRRTVQTHRILDAGLRGLAARITGRPIALSDAGVRIHMRGNIESQPGRGRGGFGIAQPQS